MCEQGSKMVEVILAHTTKSLKTHVLVDKCIASIIKMFNDNGYQTVASCCGHGIRPGIISLENGTELILCYSYKQTRMIEKLYPGLHEEMDGKIPPPMNVDDYAKLVNELETELKLQEKDNERIIQLSKTAHESMKQDRDGQKAGWDASAKVVDSIVKEMMELKDKVETNRKYIHDLETRCDPAGDIQRIASFEEQLGGLEKTLACCQESENDLVNQLKDVEAERDRLRVTISSLRTASKFKQEYDPKWQKSYDRVNDNFKQLQTEVFRLNKENADLKLGFKNMQVLHFDEKNEIKNLKDKIKSLGEGHMKVPLTSLHIERLEKENKDLKLKFYNMDITLRNDIIRLEGEVKSLGDCHVEEHVSKEEISRLNKELQRIHGHWHRQTSGYMAKIKNQRRQLKDYQKCKERLTNRINTLYPYIVHGDMNHRKWLRKAIEEHFNMYRPDPKPKIGMTIAKIESETFSQGDHA